MQPKSVCFFFTVGKQRIKATVLAGRKLAIGRARCDLGVQVARGALVLLRDGGRWKGEGRESSARPLVMVLPYLWQPCCNPSYLWRPAASLPSLIYL